jgi:aryl-alcohol dehydrogenase-like predicted oxidoreductase
VSWQLRGCSRILWLCFVIAGITSVEQFSSNARAATWTLDERDLRAF